jgi:hypothetical protein
MELYGIPWNLMESHGTSWNVTSKTHHWVSAKVSGRGRSSYGSWADRSRASRYIFPLGSLFAPQGFVSIQYFTDISDSYPLCLTWNLTEAHGIPRNLMESHGTSWNPTEPHGIPWNLMESHGRFCLSTKAAGPPTQIASHRIHLVLPLPSSYL